MNKIPGQDGYTLVYDFINEGPRIFIPLLGFIAAIIGYYHIKSSIKSTDKRTDVFGVSEQNKKGCFGLILLLGGVCFGLYALGIIDYFKTRDIYFRKRYQQVSGYVTNVNIFTTGKFDAMSFDVGGYKFLYSSNDILNYGCTYQDIAPSRIRDSTYVRLTFYNKNGNNLTLKVETK